MDQDVLGYSSHDWRKHTDDAVVVDHKTKMKVNESRVILHILNRVKRKLLMCQD